MFIIPVLVYDTFTHASMDSVSYPIPLWQLRSLSPPIFFLCSSNVFNVLRNFIIGFGSRHAALSIRFASWPKQSCAHYNKDLCLAMSLQFIIIICLGSVLMQMPEADAGAVHRTANQNRNLFLKRVHIIPEDIKNSSKNIGIVRRTLE